MKIDFLKSAFALAKKGAGFTSPNPCVGAVIVKGDKIVAEGYHKQAGHDHAEIVAIKQLMNKAGIVTTYLDSSLFQNAELYVTLEPCSHSGKTLPCAKAIVSAGFKKVYIGMKDPFKKVNGKGIKYLKDGGVKVEVLKAGTSLSNEIRFLNQAFIKWAEYELPYVILKAGMSLDGKISTGSGESKWITSSKAREDARLERSKCDAVMVGVGTVLADDPELGVHRIYKNKNLLRVLIDPDLKSPLNRKIFRDSNVLVICKSNVAKIKFEKFKKRKINVKKFPGTKISTVSLFKYLAKKRIQSVFVEGGSGVSGYLHDDFLKNDLLIDKVLFYVSPKIIGGEKALSVVGGSGAARLSKIRNFKNFNVVPLGEDIKIEGFYNLF